MPNGARGEVTAELAGAERTLCLTLGALAEIETGLDVQGFEALAARMRTLSAGDLMVVLAALLRGGGEGELARGLGEARVDPRAAAEAVARAFAAAAWRDHGLGRGDAGGRADGRGPGGVLAALGAGVADADRTGGCAEADVAAGARGSDRSVAGPEGRGVIND